MSYFRSYFEKNNTIIKNSQVNTAKNPTTEIFYGSGFSKFIFKLDLTDLEDKVTSGDLVVTTGTTHTLHLTNTIFGDEGLKGQNRSTARDRSTSFDLILFKVSEFWDEGIGFDYEDGGYDYTMGNHTFDERPSNWFNRTTLNEWTSQGVYASNPDVVASIHFDNGNEDINVDITHYVNGIILPSGTTIGSTTYTGGTNHGLGLAFAVLYQDLTPEVDQSVAFFTKYTQTFYEPYLESYFEDRILDNRHNFVEKVNQNLFLYVTKGTNFYDLDDLPTVDVLNSSGAVITGLSDLETVKIKKGIYKVTFGIGGVLCDGKKFFYDKWKNLSIDGVSISDVTQKFIPKPYTSQYSIGENQTELQRYSIQFFGIKQNEKIIRGENRKVVITMRSIDYPKSVLFDEIYYRMFIKEGNTNVIIHDWTALDTTNENSFFLDTSIYIPREYFIEIKGKTHTEEIFYDEYIKFEILSEK
jgi:hypothetical protein